MPTNNPQKQKFWSKNFYLKNRSRQIAEAKQRKRDRWDWYMSYLTSLNRKCGKCGESDPACLDFHHLNPSSKEGAISKMVRDMRPIKLIIAEIEKCVTLCANCHRKLHYYDETSGVVKPVSRVQIM